MGNNSKNSVEQPKITSEQFCSIQGLNEFNSFCINREFSGQEMTYDKWFELASVSYVIGFKKDTTQTI